MVFLIKKNHTNKLKIMIYHIDIEVFRNIAENRRSKRGNLYTCISTLCNYYDLCTISDYIIRDYNIIKALYTTNNIIRICYLYNMLDG